MRPGVRWTRFYALVATTGGVSIDAAHAARLEVSWWELHRQRQHRRLADDSQLETALADLYAYAYGVPRDAMLEAARWRVRAMDLSDRWVADGRRRDDPLLWQERRALVRSYTALRNVIQEAGTVERRGRCAARGGRSTPVTASAAQRFSHYTRSRLSAPQNGPTRPPKFGGYFTARLLGLGAEATRQPWAHEPPTRERSHRSRS